MRKNPVNPVNPVKKSVNRNMNDVYLGTQYSASSPSNPHAPNTKH